MTESANESNELAVMRRNGSVDVERVESGMGLDLELTPVSIEAKPRFVKSRTY